MRSGDATAAVRVLFALAVSIVTGCASAPSVLPGDAFPVIEARTLDGEPITFPDDTMGAPTVLVVHHEPSEGWTRRPDYDAFRWLGGLAVMDTPAQVYLVLPLPGWWARLFASVNEDVARREVCVDDHDRALRLYGEGVDRLEEVTGRPDDAFANVIVLDDRGVVGWSHADGFSKAALRTLEAALQEVRPSRSDD